jgi:hypothetical protein
MKKSLLITLFLLGVITLPAKSAVTVEESTDAEYLINSGYSQTMAEDVFVLKNRNTGRPIESLYKKSENRVTRILKTIYAYIDPAQELPDRIHHDIVNKPSYSDL